MEYREITFDGKKIEYVIQGKGPVLLFLHGAFLRVKIFESLITQLSEHYTVIAPNLPGHGKSDPAEKMSSLKTIAQHMNRFLEEIHMKPRYVVGFSFGGGVALHLSLIRNIKKMVVIDPFAIPIRYPLKEFMKRYFIDIPKYWFENGGTQTQFNKVIQDSIGNMWDIKGHVPKMFGDFINLYEKNRVSIGKIKTKTLLLWGKDDELFDASWAERLASRNRRFQYEIVPGDHAWPLMYTDLCVSKIRSFCRTKFFLWEWLFPKVR